MLEHFTKMPVSMLCHPDILTDKAKRQLMLQQLSHGQLEQIRSLRSFRKYAEVCGCWYVAANVMRTCRFVEDSTPIEQRALLLDDNHAKVGICSAICFHLRVICVQ